MLNDRSDLSRLRPMRQIPRASRAQTQRRIEHYLEILVERGGTDLHLTVGAPPRVRIDGDIVQLNGDRPLDEDEAADLVFSLLTEEQSQRLLMEKSVDFSLHWRDRARLRISAFSQRRSLVMTIRALPYEIPTFEELGLPPVFERLVKLESGLVLVTGPTGSGKTTTAASMLRWINENRPVHILTIEDPIEYVHRHDKALVNQRELGEDAVTFADALKTGLRQDPDVVLIGEMRDLETIQTALTIAETGHLVFATLHTNDTSQAIDRIVDVFPGDRQTQIKVQLANAIQAVIYQRLIPRIDGGRIAAFEVLVANNPVRNLILQGKTRQMRNMITTGFNEGMQTFEMSLSDRVRAGLISYEDAVARSLYPEQVQESRG